VLSWLLLELYRDPRSPEYKRKETAFEMCNCYLRSVIVEKVLLHSGDVPDWSSCL
jgi:hypothetical protein